MSNVPINPQPATLSSIQAQGSTINFDNTNGQTNVPIDHHPITTNHSNSAEDHEDGIEKASLEPNRRNDQWRTTSRTNRKTIHLNVRSDD